MQQATHSAVFIAVCGLLRPFLTGGGLILSANDTKCIIYYACVGSGDELVARFCHCGGVSSIAARTRLNCETCGTHGRAQADSSGEVRIERKTTYRALFIAGNGAF